MKSTFTFLFWLVASSLLAQEFQSLTYLFPIKPGEQNYLAGTVGEIRRSHFHTGIDIKTGGATGLPVYATADGFVSRVKVSPFGYGTVLYMQHPNGTFSVYAHLESFATKVADWVRKTQYKKESFAVDLYPEVNQFTFKQGDIIGYSGNTGSSSGPHLHFEIRDGNHQPIDVLSLGFDEVRDRLAPVVKKIAFETLDTEARINGYFGRYEFNLSPTADRYTLSTPLSLQGKIGVEIYGYDPMDGVPNKNGIVKTTLKVDDEVVFLEKKERFNFGKQRDILAHYNYRAAQRGSKRFNRLYLSDGNKQNIYLKTNRGIDFAQQSKLEITNTDSHGNTSTAYIQLASVANAISFSPPVRAPERISNFFHFTSSQTATIGLDDWIPLEPYQESKDRKYYVWDMRKGLPKQLVRNGDTTSTDLVAVIPSDQTIDYVQNEFTLAIKHTALFDTLYLGFKKTYDSTRNQETFHFKNAIDPLRSSISVTLKPEGSYNSEKAQVYAVYGKKHHYIGGTWKGGQITFKTRDLVAFTIREDTIPPTITPVQIGSDRLRFRIRDDLSGIKTYRSTIDGAFILMHYDPKRQLIWSEKLNANIPFRGEFVLELVDNSNNSTIFKKQIL